MNRRSFRLLAMMLGGGPSRRWNPFLALYRLRYEIAAIVVVIALWRLGPLVPLVVAITMGAAVVGFPRLRRSLAGRVRAVVIQHRLRSAFRGAALSSWGGKTPAILWTSPRPRGTRVLVNLPAGLEPADVRELRGVLAAACFAPDVLVEHHPTHSNLVVVYVGSRAQRG